MTKHLTDTTALLLAIALFTGGCGRKLNRDFQSLGNDSDRVLLPALTTEAWGVPWSYEHTIRADVLEHRGDLAGAVMEMNKAVEGDPTDPSLRVKFAGLLLRTEDMERAARQLNRAVLIDPACTQAWIAMAGLYLKTGDKHRAVKSAETAVRINAGSADALFWLGAYYAEEGDDGKALSNYYSGLRIDPDNAGAHLALFQILDRAGRPGEALTHFETYLSSGEGTPEMIRDAAKRSHQSGDADLAIRLLETLLQSQPDDTATRAQLIDILIEQGLFARASAHISNLDNGAIDDDASLRRAALYEKIGDYWSAREELVQTFGETPQAAVIRAALSRIELALGRTSEAHFLLRGITP